jgi:hypothetical protein
MSEVLERIDLFAESEPRICVWCKCCVAMVGGYTWGYACTKSAEDITKRHKGAIMPFPPSTGGKRTRVQCVNPDEMHDCFEPTKLTDKRIKLLDALGLMP